MISNQKLFSVGNFDFRLQHLLVIGILILSISISMLIRSTPASYGYELFEFDPFFNLRATEYILNNGSDAYFDWIDEKSWYPFGRNISETSQVTLHFSSAYMYQIFGFGTSLYDFTVLFPLVIGSLTAVLVFAFVRVLGGTTAGLFAALMFSISVPIFSRGLIGWFKSEPLGLFFAFAAIYLLVSGIKFNQNKISAIKLIFGGLFLALGISAWGGILFFIVPIALFYLFLPFFKHEKNFSIWAAPIFSISFILFSLMFERTQAFVIGYSGIIILLPTIFVIMSEIIKKFSSEKTKIRNCLILLGSIILTGLGISSSGLINLPSFRYLNAVNPFLISSDTLTDSVAEHMTTNQSLSFSLLSVFLIFGLIGIWLIFSKRANLKPDMKIFALVTGILAIYISSAFVRLELYASVGLLILGSIGLSILLQKILVQEKQYFTKIIFPSIIVVLFILPVVLPDENNWLSWSDFAPSILTGGSASHTDVSADWFDAMTWLKENSEPDAVIAAWWDYGYWITTLSDRSTLVDNATLIDWQIKKVAFSLITTPNNSWHILGSHYSEDVSQYLGDETILAMGGELKTDFEKRYLEEHGDSCKHIFLPEATKLGIPAEACNPASQGMDADYVVIYLAGERFYVDGISHPLFTLEGGGDESKKAWFVKISGLQSSKFIQDDNITPTQYFMDNSALGQMIPYSIIKYVEPNTGRTFDQYQNGFIPVYVNDLKFNNPETDPFIFVYASPSFYSQQPGTMNLVLIYKINPDYQPIQEIL
tara:strand:- start:142 stop:2433 length:2292 start_codon:yes stop_codon:yes gene_type:complete